jgi:hypothetical protein
LLFWVYQKPTDYSALDLESFDENGVIFDDKFLQEKKDILKNFIHEIESSKRYEGLFNEKDIEYLLKTSVLDARGLSDDNEAAQNAVALVLQKYFSLSGNAYCQKAGEILSGDNKTPHYNVMTYTTDPTDTRENIFIKNMIIKKIKESSNPSIETARNIFLDALCVDLQDDLSGFPFDLKVTLENWLELITDLIDDIIETIEMPKKGLIGKKPGIISIDKLNSQFWNDYGINKPWQGLLFHVQAYHWLKASYSNLITPQYINNIGNSILNKIKGDISRLEEPKNLLHLQLMSP